MAKFTDILRGGIEAISPSTASRNEAERSAERNRNEAKRQREFLKIQKEADQALRSKEFANIAKRLDEQLARRQAAQPSEIEAATKALNDARQAEASDATIQRLSDNLDRAIGISPSSGVTGVDPGKEIGTGGISRDIKQGVKAIGDFLPTVGLDPGVAEQGFKESLGTGKSLIPGMSFSDEAFGIPPQTAPPPTAPIPGASAIDQQALGFGAPGAKDATAMRNGLVQANVFTEQMERQLPATSRAEDFGIETPLDQMHFSIIEKKIPNIREIMVTPEGLKDVKFFLDAIGRTKDGKTFSINDAIAILKKRFGIQ